MKSSQINAHNKERIMTGQVDDQTSGRSIVSVAFPQETVYTT